VFAQATAFTTHRHDPAAGTMHAVVRPTVCRCWQRWPRRAGDLPRERRHAIRARRSDTSYGSEGTLRIELTPQERIFGARQGDTALDEIAIPADERGGWNVEADFVAAIREGRKIAFTSFAAGVRYMEFTDAVARSAATARRSNWHLN